MAYLAHALVWYVAIAFVIGLFVGWNTCSRNDNR